MSSSPAVVDGKVYMGSSDHYFYCLDAESGSVLQTYSTRNNIESSPAVADGKIFVGCLDGYVYCFVETVIPEFPSATMLPLFTFATLITMIARTPNAPL